MEDRESVEAALGKDSQHKARGSSHPRALCFPGNLESIAAHHSLNAANESACTCAQSPLLEWGRAPRAHGHPHSMSHNTHCRTLAQHAHVFV